MSSKPQPKGYREAFARFFENPTREGLREVLKENVGELNELDFKETWPESSSLAKHILGIGNSGGGCIVVGIEDESLEPKGLTTIEDKTKVINGLKNYIPPALLDDVDIVHFPYDATEYPKLSGKKFQVVFIDEDKKHLPFVSLRAGSSIRANTIYVRRGAATEEANYDELQKMINTRLETGYSSTIELDLQSHLQQLKVLFQQIDRNLIKGMKGGIVGASLAAIGEMAKSLQIESVPNPKFPEEDFDAFVVRLIRLKKKRVEEEIDVQHLAGE